MEALQASYFVSWMESVRRRTRAVANAVPEKHLEWSPDPGRFTPGDILRHIAAAQRWMWGENALGRPSRYPGHGRDLAEGKTAVLAYLDDTFRETAEIVGALTPDDLRQECTTVGGVHITVWKWLRLAMEHEIHHRGQLYQILGTLGIEVPPLYGLTEPQVRERSEPAQTGTARTDGSEST